jgi:membrane dipeptidase
VIEVSNEAQQVHEAALIIDLHCDLLLTQAFLRWNWGKRHRPNPLPRAALFGHCDIPRMKSGNVGCAALGIVTWPFAGPRAAHRMFDRLDRTLARHPDDLVLATTAQGIRTARAQDKIACFGGLEGVHCLNGGLDQLPLLRDRGLRYVGLMHFSANAAGRPMVGWGGNPDSPLTDYGRAVVDECERLDLVVDVAHLNRAGVFEVCARANDPVICSHTACNGVFSSPRGLDDDQLKAIADTGGVIGVIFVTAFIGAADVDAVVRHMTHIRDTVGIDHVALGTDWEGFSLYPRELDGADKLPRLTQKLLSAGWTPEEVHKAYGENFLRVLAAVAG